MKKTDSGCTNPNCTCENCTCNPCICGTEKLSCCSKQSNSCCHGKFWFWAIIRIAIVVGMIMGAFYLGTLYGYGKHNGGYERMNSYSERMEKRSELRGGRDESMNKNMVEDCKAMPNMPMCAMMNNSGSHDMMSMSMSDMSKMLEGKTGDALDKAFLEGMIPHHQGAVDMAKYLVNAKHPELQKMGQDIIKAQTTEIEQMKKWMKDWGYSETKSINSQTGMHMMSDGSMMHN